MDGSSLSLIVIPIVVSISLALWLVIVFYAASHPLWGPRRAAGTKRVSPARRAGGAAASRTSPCIPSPVAADTGSSRTPRLSWKGS
jgi:hypothetical protein